MEILIPLRHRAGEYTQEQLPQSGDALHLTLTDYSCIIYRHPVYGWEIRVYNVPENAALTAVYAEDGALSEISFASGDARRYVFIAKPDLQAFIAETVPALTERVLSAAGDRAISRLFFESFYDGEAADFAVKLGTPDDMAEIRAKYGADTDAVDNSGDYAAEKRIECDNALFALLLRCAPPEEEDLFEETAAALTEQMTARVLPLLHKTEDFRVIAEEYD